MDAPAAEEDVPIDPLGAPTDPLRPTGRVRGGGPPSRASWPGRRTRLFLVVLGIAVVVVVLLAIVVGSVLPRG